MILFLRSLDRPDVEDFLTGRVADAADGEGDDPEHDQDDTDELHVCLRFARMHTWGQRSGEGSRMPRPGAIRPAPCPPSFRLHRPGDEVLNLRIDLERAAQVGGPVLLIRPHLVQTLLDLRIAARESLDERSPAGAERLRARA